MMPTGPAGAASASGVAQAASKESKKGKALKFPVEGKTPVGGKKKTPESKTPVAKPTDSMSGPATKVSASPASKLAPIKARPESKKGELPPLKVATPQQQPLQQASPQPGPGGTGGTGSSADAGAAPAAQAAATDSKIASTGGVSNDAPVGGPESKAETKNGEAPKIDDDETAKIAKLVAKLTPEERAFFQGEFDRFDEDKSGFISLEEFQQVMGELGAGVKDDELQQIYHSLDANGDGQLDFNEFMALMVTFMEPSTAEELKEAFMVFDADGGGTVSREELQKVFDMLGKNCPVSHDEADRLFALADKDGDGQLDYDEFVNFLSPPKSEA